MPYLFEHIYFILFTVGRIWLQWAKWKPRDCQTLCDEDFMVSKQRFTVQKSMAASEMVFVLWCLRIKYVSEVLPIHFKLNAERKINHKLVLVNLDLQTIFLKHEYAYKGLYESEWQITWHKAYHLNSVSQSECLKLPYKC